MLKRKHRISWHILSQKGKGSLQYFTKSPIYLSAVMQKAFYIIAGTNNYKAIARDPLPSKSFLNKSQEGCTVLKL